MTYVVSRYLKYRMVDERLVETYCHEHHKIVNEIIIEDMSLDEQFQITFMIDKFPHNLKDFKNFASPQNK